MMTNSLVLVAAAAVVLPATLASGQNILIDDQINQLLAGFDEIIEPDHPLEITANDPHVAEFSIVMDEVDITGVNDFASYGSNVEILNLGGEADVYIRIRSPKVTLNTGHYTIDGIMVDHLELYGEGPGMISVDDMDITLTGSGNVTFNPFSVVFSEASIDLEMWRWTVNLQGLMPGTDLGTVFNEFFTMCGPEIFDTIENKWNSSGKLLNFLNNLCPPTENQIPTN